MTPSDFQSSLQSLGWSQADFNRRTGITQNTISRWISGEIPKLPLWVAAFLEMALAIKQLTVFVRKTKP